MLPEMQAAAEGLYLDQPNLLHKHGNSHKLPTWALEVSGGLHCSALQECLCLQPILPKLWLKTIKCVSDF